MEIALQVVLDPNKTESTVQNTMNYLAAEKHIISFRSGPFSIYKSGRVNR